MMVERERVEPGANFRFADGNRRVVSIENGQVRWVYADGIKRIGQDGGSERIKYFAKEAIEEYQESHADIALSVGRYVFTKPLFIALNVVLFALVFAVWVLNN